MAYQNLNGVEISAFKKGRDTKHSLFELDGSHGTDVRNISFDDAGALRSRLGVINYNSDVIATAVVDGLYSYTPNTMSANLIAVVDGSAYVATGTATAFNLINSSSTVWTAGVHVEMHQFQDLLFMSNGYVKPYKFNGTEFTQAGVSAPSVALTAATNATGGNLTGDYNYVFTGVNSYAAEGDYGSASATWTGVGENALVGGIPTAPASAGIESWNIYRNTASAAGVYWKVTNISNGVTSFTDDVADSSLVTQAPTDNGTPRQFKYMESMLGRLWGAGESTNPDLLWFSEVNEPETFPSTNYIRIGRGDGMRISGIKAFQGMLVITKSNFSGRSGIYNLYVGDPVTASDPANWYLTKANSPEGSESHMTLVPFANHLALWNRNGLFAYNGANLQTNPNATENGTFITDKLSYPIDNDLVETNSSTSGWIYVDDIELSTAIAYKNKLYISFPHSYNTTGRNIRVVVYDYSVIGQRSIIDGIWDYRRYETNGGLSPSVWCIHENMLLGGTSSGGSYGGYVFQYETGTQDISPSATLDIDSLWNSGPIRGKKNHEDVLKDFRWMYVTYDVAPYTLLVHIYTEKKTTPTKTITVDMTLQTAGEKYRTEKLYIGVTARYIQVRFENYEEGTFVIRKYQVFYTPRSLRN